VIPPFVSVFDDAASLADDAALQFADVAREAIEERGLFRVALAGGTTPAGLYRHLVVEPFVSVIRWASVHVFWGDERCVPECSADRNDLGAREAFISLVPLPPENVHPIPASLPDGASRYEETLRSAFGGSDLAVPRFDLVLLGIGPDGHTASLFPGQASLEEQQRLAVRVLNAPKPPRERITLTLPVLNAARAVTFLAAGSEKADAVKKAIAGDPSIPAGLVRPHNGRLSFFLDPEAAARL
jgi:6-phosphogluconolactonase